MRTLLWSMGRLIQFMHPGNEPDERPPAAKLWNTGDHRRSFLLGNGMYADARGQGEVPASLLFWGEWEAPSTTHAVALGPARAVHVPGNPGREQIPGAQNSDPFVFDGPFLYACCKQVRRNGSATYLRDLKRGDVILFGSHVAGSFVLDTVFVVRASVLYSASSPDPELVQRVPRAFVEATLKPLAPHIVEDCTPQQSATCAPEEWGDEDEARWGEAPSRGPATEFRLYWGATPSEPVDGMFSFAPASIHQTGHVTAFARPELDSLQYIRPRMTAGFRDCLRDEPTARTVADCWREIVAVVAQRELVLGSFFELNEKVRP